MVHSLLQQVMGVVPWFLLQCMYRGLGEVALDAQVPGGQGSSPWQLLEYGKNDCVPVRTKHALHSIQSKCNLHLQ